MRLLAPIVLFVYNRPSYTQKVLDCLAANAEAKDSILYIYCDGTKQGANKDVLHKIEETRSIARKENRFKAVQVVEQSGNMGLANSIMTGVSEICNKYGSIIVLEDDIATSPFFLRYMNDALHTYKDVEGVGSISGYWYPTKKHLPEVFFLKSQSCWGWATWTRAWNAFEPDGSKLLSKLTAGGLTREFDLEGSMKYTEMLRQQIAGKIDSWAIRWDATNFTLNKMSLFSSLSLVQNIGFDGSGIHSKDVNYYDVVLSDHPINVPLLPVVEDSSARKALVQFYRKINKDIFFRRLHKLFSILRVGIKPVR
jgi:hypothetical protein